MDYCCKVPGAGITLLACIVPSLDSAAQTPLDDYTVQIDVVALRFRIFAATTPR